MGLDIVELVMRTEEVFGITIPDEHAGQISAVGELYEVVCARLGLPPSPTHPTGSALPRALVDRTPASLRITPESSPLAPWSHEEVWATLVALTVDQLQVDESEVRYDARWRDDLGAD